MDFKAVLVIVVFWAAILAESAILVVCCGMDRVSAFGYSFYSIAIAACLLFCWLRTNLFPKCEHGACRAVRDYKCIGAAKELGILQPGVVWECKCGCRYVKISDKEIRFYRLGLEGRLQKFRVKYHYLGAWKVDE